jgi:lysophospholipase L1-like esterase
MRRSRAFHIQIVCRTAVLVLAAIPAATARAAELQWVGTWATASTAQNADNLAAEFALGSTDVTLREIVHTSVAGNAIRIVLTNEFGTLPLKIGGTEVGISGGSDGVRPGSEHAVSFNGHSEIMIPAGAVAVSDPVELVAPAQTNLVVSLFVPSQPLSTLSCHSPAGAMNFISSGDQIAALTLNGAHAMNAWVLLKSVDVITQLPDAGTIVALGDSITDGLGSTIGANSRWPDILAARLQTDPRTRRLGILNLGISGNHVLHDGVGPNALSRFDRDVLSQSGVKYLVIFEGINDIGGSQRDAELKNTISPDDLIWGLTQLSVRAHIHGIKVYGVTLTPYEGAGYFSLEGEKIRLAVNSWIRTSGVLDGVIDFDKTTRDPLKRSSFLPEYDHGDHLHPSDEGYKAMGLSINLALFK